MTHAVTLDRSGIAIDGEPLFLLAGQLHYFRYPKAEWRDLLLGAKAGGLNTIDTVIPWNLHEPIEGEFDWQEEADLAGFLDLCQELGLWAIVRPGPYICAEWENGGFPAWFTAKPGIELRLDNPVFLEHTLRWFDTLFPLLVPRQAHQGGAILLCQIENEHWASGRYGHDEHQHSLANAAIERGMQVPQYTCMGATPGYAEFRNGWSGIAEKLVATRALWPENPMIVSELWSGWFDNWGASRKTHKTPERFDTILSQLLAVGASGFSHWMWAGGTNFGFWGGRTVGGDTVHMTTSYDYDAPVTEYGGVTEKFYVARRHHLLLGTLGAQLAPILADAVPGGPKVISPAAVAGRGEAGAAPYRNVRSGPDAPAAWRDFTATFLQNTIPEGLTHQVYFADGTHLAIEVEANTIKPVFANMPLDGGRWTADGGQDTVHRPPSTVLSYHTSRILGFWQGEAVDTLVFYGFAGEVGEFRVRGSGVSVQESAQVEVSEDDKAATVRYWIRDQPTVVQLDAAGRGLNVVLLTTERAERFWPIADGSFVIGPDLVVDGGQGDTETGRHGDGETRRRGDEIQITTDNGQLTIGSRQTGVLPFYTLAADGTLERQNVSHLHNFTPSALVFTTTTHDVVERTEDAGWTVIERPVALEKLGCPYGYGWYRTTLRLEAATTLSLVAPDVNDRVRLILDGVDCGWLGLHPHGPRFAMQLPLAAGAHDLRLLVDNLGRFNYGSRTGELKGLLDGLYHGEQYDITKGWTALWQEATFAGEAIANAKPWAVRADASPVDLASFGFQGPSVWLLRAFEATEGKRYILHLIGDRSSGGLFVNGQNVARFSRHYGGGFIRADISSLVQPGTNVIALNIQNYAGMAYRAVLIEYDPQQPIGQGWSFRAGVNRITAEAATRSSQPVFHRITFAYDPATHGSGLFKFYPGGLRKGQIWLNGRGVGRYWQIGPQEAYKLPASWLQPENELLVFDEEGGDVSGAWVGG